MYQANTVKCGADFYNINLNTFINPQGNSLFLKNLKNATEGEYEAFGYLGLGMLIMTFLAIVLIINNNNKEKLIEILKKPTTWFYIICLFLSILISMGTNVKLNSRILFEIPYPTIIVKVLNVFRAIGRFIWDGCYIIFFCSIFTVSKYLNNKKANIIIVILLIIQLLDLSAAINNKFSYEERSYGFDEQKWEQTLENCEHIVCLNFTWQDSDRFFDIAYVAMKNDCTLNNFYLQETLKE